MEATHKDFSFLDSLGRMDEILNADSKQFEEKNSIPLRNNSKKHDELIMF